MFEHTRVQDESTTCLFFRKSNEMERSCCAWCGAAGDVWRRMCDKNTLKVKCYQILPNLSSASTRSASTTASHSPRTWTTGDGGMRWLSSTLSCRHTHTHTRRIFTLWWVFWMKLFFINSVTHYFCQTMRLSSTMTEAEKSSHHLCTDTNWVTASNNQPDITSVTAALQEDMSMKSERFTGSFTFLSQQQSTETSSSVGLSFVLTCNF